MITNQLSKRSPIKPASMFWKLLVCGIGLLLFYTSVVTSIGSRDHLLNDNGLKDSNILEASTA